MTTKYRQQLEHYHRAFNRGADARLAKRPRHACPYRRIQKRMRHFWMMGWDDVDRNWGSDLKDPARRLLV